MTDEPFIELLERLRRGGPDAPSWVLDELEVARRAAQADADRAYAAWSASRGADEYARYRAAQDQADAALDAVAGWLRARADGSGDEQPAAAAGHETFTAR